jgi:hypothetical protein
MGFGEMKGSRDRIGGAGGVDGGRRKRPVNNRKSVWGRTRRESSQASYKARDV